MYKVRAPNCYFLKFIMFTRLSASRSQTVCSVQVSPSSKLEGPSRWGSADSPLCLHVDDVGSLLDAD